MVPLIIFEIVVYDLGDRCQTIRGAGCVRNDVMLGRIVLVVIHPEGRE